MRECLGRYEESIAMCARLCPKRARCKAKSVEVGEPLLKGVPKGKPARWKPKGETGGGRTQQTRMPKVETKSPPSPKSTRKPKRNLYAPKGMPRPLVIELPYPIHISINNYYVRTFGGYSLNPLVRSYKAVAVKAVKAAGRLPMRGRLRATLDLYPPDHKKRDLDNVLKPILDSLLAGGAFGDDFQIELLVVQRRAVAKSKSRAVVRIERYVEEDDNDQE